MNGTCIKCSSPLSSLDIGTTRKFLGRGSETFMCKRCVAKELKVPEELIDRKIEYFKSQGCLLFCSRRFKCLKGENDMKLIKRAICIAAAALMVISALSGCKKGKRRHWLRLCFKRTCGLGQFRNSRIFNSARSQITAKCRPLAL